MSKERIKPEGITGDGLSGMPSRSQLAQARELERIRNAGYKWATQEWYNAKAEQQTVDGQVLCGDCEKPEPKRIKRGTPRPLTVDESNERLICSKCDSKIRSQKARERIANAEKKYVSNEDWWAQQRQSLSPAELEEFQTRENKVLDLEIQMTYWLNGIAEDVRTPFEKLVNQVEREAGSHGLQYHTPEELNLHDHHAEVLENNKEYSATRDYVLYGFQTSIQSQLYWDFLKLRLKAAPRCMTHGCTNSQGKLEPWFCDGCSLERTKRSNAHHRGVTPPGHEDRMYGVQGEWRTADTSNAAWFQKLPGA